MQTKLRRVQSAVSGRDLGKKLGTVGGEEEGPMVEGGSEVATTLPRESRESSEKGGGRVESLPPDLPKPVDTDENGGTTGTPTGGEKKSRSSARGGLSIEYRNMGENEPRGKYSLDRRQITINLDHPQVAAAYEMGGAEEISFARLTAEIATAEYAVALATELVESYTIADEAIYDIHDTVDRVSRRFAPLYGTK